MKAFEQLLVPEHSISNQLRRACRLSQELRPWIKKNEGRVVAVSSGGMLNVKYDHGYATGTKGSYDKQLSYAYAKRAQVPRCAAINVS